MWYPLFEVKLNPMFGAATDVPPAAENLASAEETCAERKEIMKKAMTIEGMMCGHCTGRVHKALEAVTGTGYEVKAVR